MNEIKIPAPMPRDARVYVAGHRGLVGSALVRRLQRAGCTNVLTATREQLDLRDQAENYDDDEHVNVGTGEDLAIRELAEMVRDVVAPGLEIVFDTDKPDGMPRKLLDVSRLHDLGWRHRIPLRQGIETTYRWFLDNWVPAEVGEPAAAVEA